MNIKRLNESGDLRASFREHGTTESKLPLLLIISR